MSEYIEREALLQAILDLPPKMDEQGYGWLGRRGVWQMVNDFPAADVRPVVRGKLLPDYDQTEFDYDGSTPLPEPRKFQDGWQCSLCGKYTPSETNFCPNCGADMREGR